MFGSIWPFWLIASCSSFLSKKAWKKPYLKKTGFIFNLVTFMIVLPGGIIYKLFYYRWLINHG
jgi:hypothetical protein